jgi:prepilin-type N-terminal cleavage/methylation domain-containing protein
MKNTKGFSLVELLLVVTIIGIIMSIAVPALLAARRASNESAAIGNLKTIDSAESAYLAQTGRSADFATMSTSAYLDNGWSNGIYRTGFVYTEVAITPSTGEFYFSAMPSSTGNGNRSFTLIEDHIVRVTNGIVLLGRGAGSPIGS